MCSSWEGAQGGRGALAEDPAQPWLCALLERSWALTGDWICIFSPEWHSASQVLSLGRAVAAAEES